MEEKWRPEKPRISLLDRLLWVRYTSHSRFFIDVGAKAQRNWEMNSKSQSWWAWEPGAPIPSDALSLALCANHSSLGDTSPASQYIWQGWSAEPALERRQDGVAVAWRFLPLWLFAHFQSYSKGSWNSKIGLGDGGGDSAMSQFYKLGLHLKHDIFFPNKKEII